MKYFVATFTIYDGEHEHYDRILIKAATVSEANAHASNLEHDTDCYGHTHWDAEPNDEVPKSEQTDEHPFCFSDGQTGSRNNFVSEITAKQYKFLKGSPVCLYESTPPLVVGDNVRIVKLIDQKTVRVTRAHIGRIGKVVGHDDDMLVVHFDNPRWKDAGFFRQELERVQ